MEFTLGSLFDGIGGWPLAATKFSIQPIWASEIEKYPMAVTRRHFPSMKHLGDITKIDGSKVTPIDILCAGSPCQNLSVAGNREGLRGKQSSLFMESIRILREMRNATNGLYPKFFVWENVPGAFSSNQRHDFQAVLQEITKTDIPMPYSGRWSNAGVVRSNGNETAWRVLDAQYWGVPQRRKRIFLVCSFGGDYAAKVLFESESLPWDTTASEGTRESITESTYGSTRTAIIFKERAGKPGGGKGILVDETGKSFTIATNQDQAVAVDLKNGIVTGDVCCSLTTGSRSSSSTGPSIYDMSHPCDVIRECEDVVPTLPARMGTGGNNIPLVNQTYCIAGNTIDRKLQNGGNGKGVNEGVSFTLNTMDRHAVCSVFPSESYSQFSDKHNAASLKASGGCLGGGSENIANINGVRRLTPLECERLQGLPDGWTACGINADGSKVDGSDTARYKAIGNGMAQPCADYVVCGIANILKDKNRRN